MWWSALLFSATEHGWAYRPVDRAALVKPFVKSNKNDANDTEAMLAALYDELVELDNKVARIEKELRIRTSPAVFEVLFHVALR